MVSRIANHVRRQAVGYLALMIALSGTATAAVGGLPVDSVGTKQLKDGAVTGTKVGRHTLTGANIKLSTLGAVPNAARLGGLPVSAFQRLVSGSCTGGGAIAQIASNGQVVCQTFGSGNGTITGVTAGAGLSGGGSSGNVSLSVANGGIGASQLADGAVGNAKLAQPSFTITPGAGLSGGGPIALGGAGTLSVDPTVVQTRVDGTCSTGNAIASINQDGTVGCQSGSSALAGQHCTPGADAPMAFDSSAVLACYPTVVGPDCRSTNHQHSHQQLCDFRPAGSGAVNLAVSDLRGANFSGMNLTGPQPPPADGSNLANANMRWANLQGTNLSDANLGTADLEFANLTGATLTGANLGAVNWFMATCPDGHVVTTIGGVCP